MGYRATQTQGAVDVPKQEATETVGPRFLSACWSSWGTYNSVLHVLFPETEFRL